MVNRTRRRGALGPHGVALTQLRAQDATPCACWGGFGIVWHRRKFSPCQPEEAMPERAALITALIMERPLCLSCIAERASTTGAEVQAAFEHIGHVLELRREHGRCRTCGNVNTVYAIHQPAVSA